MKKIFLEVGEDGIVYVNETPVHVRCVRACGTKPRGELTEVCKSFRGQLCLFEYMQGCCQQVCRAEHRKDKNDVCFMPMDNTFDVPIKEGYHLKQKKKTR